MPSVKVCLWNIQNYGWGDVSRKWGADSDLRNWIITRFVRDQAIDVLLVMEMTQGGESSLRDLMRTLISGPTANQDWATTYCGSALDKRAANPPTSAAQLTFKTDARYEGYAVAWRTGQTTRFSVLPGLHPIDVNTSYAKGKAEPAQPLNLTTVGRPADNVTYTIPRTRKTPAKTYRSWDATAGFKPPALYPYAADGKLMDEWPKLEFPATGKYSSTLRWDRARRPAYAVLELNNNGTDAERLCPVGVYHAPSNQTRAEWGGMMAGLSRELYVTNGLTGGAPDAAKLLRPARAALGGDFNYSVDGDKWPAYYEYFVGALAKAPTGGAGCSVAPPATSTDEERRTAVRLLRGEQHDEVITSDDLDDYLSYKIDLVFFRGPGTSAVRVNVPDLLMTSPAPYSDILKRFNNHLNSLIKGLVAPDQRLNPAGHGPEEWKEVEDSKGKKVWKWVPMLCGAWGGTFVSWNEFMKQLKAGKLTKARQAAEFYQIFVSDHLPLVVTITW